MSTPTTPDGVCEHWPVGCPPGIDGCIWCDGDKPVDLPDQPDGIETDSHDLPAPDAAAHRIRKYVSEAGDGLYDAVAGKPLYGRDLESVVRAVLRAELSVDQSTPYRLSPNGSLAGRTNPGWRVLVSKDPHLHWGQQLADQAVAAWSPLIRKGPST